jgi:flavin-binding protein dodecin
MSVAKVSEISATSSKSFEDAIQQGLTRSAKTLRNVRGAVDQGAARALCRRPALWNIK